MRDTRHAATKHRPPCARGWGGSLGAVPELLAGQVWKQRCHRAASGPGEPWGWAGTARGDPACSHKAGMPGETEAWLGKLRHEGLRSSLPTLLPALTLWGLALGSILCCSMAGVPPGLSRFPRHPLVSPGL